MGSPSHIEVFDTRGGVSMPAASGAAAMATTVGSAGVPSATKSGKTSERTSARRKTRPTRRERRRVVMPTSVRKASRTPGAVADKPDAEASASARSSARLREVPAPTAAKRQSTSYSESVATGESPATPAPSRKAQAVNGTRSADPAQAVGTMLGHVRSSLTASPARVRLLVVAAVLAVTVFAVYPSVRDYYVASRDREVLAARYAELSATNEELMHDITYLQSTEGIEDEARRRGYVLPGETGVAVEGLDESAAGDPTTAAHTDAPWYQGLLDGIFGYTPEEW